MPLLELHHDYSREDVHALFAPQTSFTPQSGTWGLQGIVSIPHRPGDFVFFVTFGQQQGDHIFDEGITEDGVLTWQSQPRQDLQNTQIQQFIAHDELLHNIYLFLRTAPRRNYTYLGRLKYLTHDLERERPVHFQWQILDWQIPFPAHIKAQMGLRLLPTTARNAIPDLPRSAPGLITTPMPRRLRERNGVQTQTFIGRPNADYGTIDARNRSLGRAGELAVIAYEQQRLQDEGVGALADGIRYIAQVDGDGAGYDVLSFNADGSPRYIEVKTTKGKAESSFFLSANEVAFAREYAANYYLYRVYGFDPETGQGKVYIAEGNPENAFDLTPTQYRVKQKTEESE